MRSIHLLAIFLLFLTLEQASSQQHDGICRDIKKYPVGFYPFHKSTTGQNIYGDSATEAKIKDVFYAKDIDGQFESAIRFSGSPTSYVEIPRHPALDTARDISIVFSIFPEGDGLEILSYKTTGGGVQIGQRKGSKPGISNLFVRFTKRTLLLVDDLTEECLEHNKWNIIAVTYNYDTGEACLYKNGELLKKINVGTNYIATQFPIRVGALEFGSSPFEGLVSCLQIYNFTLDLETVKQAQYTCRKTSTVLSLAESTIDHKEYPEPGNDIKLIIKEENPDTHIIIDFGDGSPKLRTREREIIHQYEERGVYKPEISLCLGCDSNNIKFPHFVRVFSYVEKPAKLSVTVPEVTLLGTEATIKATLEEGTFFNCTWDFSDNSDPVTSIYENLKTQSVNHEYKKPAIYHGSVQCFNRKATLTKSFKVDVQKPIKGLQIDPIEPQSVNRGFKVTWSVEEGFPIRFKAFIDGVEQMVVQDEMVGEAQINPSVFNNTFGVYKVSIQTSNDVTPVITEQKEIDVHPLINAVSINVPKHTIEVNETLSFVADSKNPSFKSYPHYEWEFGDGSKAMTENVNHTSHKFAMYGQALVKVTTKNPTAFHLSIVEINILRPVLLLDGLKCTAPPSLAREKAKLTCEIEIGSDFTCSVDWDGEGTTQHDFTDHKYYLEQSVAKEQFKNLKFEDSFYIEHPKDYILSINCNNRLSRVSYQTKLIVQDKVDDVDITETDPQSFGNKFSVTWQATTGTEVQYKIFWNERELLNIEFINGKPSTEITKEIYREAGIHTFAVVAWNEISEKVRKESTIIIEHDVSDLIVNLISPNPFLEVLENVTIDFKAQLGSNPHYRIKFSDNPHDVLTTGNQHIRSYANYGDFEVTVVAYNNVSETEIKKHVTVLKPVLPLGSIELSAPNENVSESVEMTAIVSQGSDFICHIIYGDGYEHNTTEMYTTYYTSIEERIIKKYENIKIPFSHAYSEVKIYTLEMTCANRLNRVSAKTEVAIFQPLVPFKILVPEINEQNSLVKIEISYENDITITKHKYNVDFGDNNKEETELNRIDHTYDEFGDYIIKVTAVSPVGSITINQKIIILKPVIALKNLRVTSNPVNLTEPTILNIRLGEGSDFKCNIIWLPTHQTTVDKSEELVYYDKLDMKPFQDLAFHAQYIYKNEGHHKVEIECGNRLGSLTKDITVITQVALKGFYIKPVLPQKFGDDFYIYYEVERGSDLTIACEFNGQSVPVIKNEKRVHITSNMYTTPGVFSFKFTGSNLVSASITRESQVVIDKEIKNVTISASKNTIEVNETVSFNVASIGGSAILYDIDFNDGNKEIAVTKTQFQHNFLVQKIYEITITAYNNISKVHGNIQVEVLKPVLPLVGLTLKAPKHINISSPYTLHLMLDQGSDFECVISYDNEQTDKITTQKSDYYTHEPRWSTAEFKNLKLNQNKAFSKVGTNKIQAKCTNRLHEIEAETSLEVHVPLSGFTIDASKQTVEINETIDFQIQGIESVIAPKFNINGGHYGKQLTTELFYFKNSFTHHGTNEVIVNATNPTSTLERSIKINVLKPVLELQGLSAMVNPTNLSDEAVLTVKMQKGSDFECEIQWGDESKKTEESFKKEYLFYKDLSLNEKPFSDIEMKFKHRFQKVGVYSINIKCQNRKNEVTANTQVDIQTPITGFKLLPVDPKRFGATFQLKWTTGEGSNLEYKVFWEKLEVDYQRSAGNRDSFATISPEHYTEARIYKYTVCAKNKVSNAGNLTSTVIIEEQLKNLDVALSKSQEVEVNETIQVKVNLGSGNNPHFKYISGDGSEKASLQLQHPVSYTKQGTYRVTVQAWNNVSRIEAEATLTVIKPVLPITKVIAETKIAYDTAKVTEITVIVKSGSDFKCSIVYGDGQQEITETMNTHYYENGHIEKMEDFKDTKIVFKHNYTQGDAYNVQVTCNNRISTQSARTKVFIQGKISDLHINAIKPQKVGEEFPINFKVAKGTNITYFVHFQNKVFRHHSDGSALMERVVSSDRPGVFSILINATNHITGILVGRVKVIIEDPIQELKIHSPEEGVKLEVGEEFEFCYGIKQGSNPHFQPVFDGHAIELTEDQTKLKMVDGKYQFCFKHKFDLHSNFTTGVPKLTLDLKLSAKNNVTDISVKKQITLMKPVLDVKMTSLTCPPTITESKTRLSLVVSGSDLICTWAMETKENTVSEISDIFHKDGISDFSKFTDMSKDHTEVYQKAGAYKANVRCENRKGSQALSTICIVQDAIARVKVEDIGSKLFGASHNIEWAQEKGTNITYTVKINGKEFKDIQIDEQGKNFVSLPKDFADSPGDYHGEIIASNLVTQNLVTKFMIRLERKLTIEDVKITYEHGKTGQDQSGHGDGSYYPVRRDLTFSMKANSDEFDIEWNIETPGLSLPEVSNQDKLFEHRFEEPGPRVVKYKISNNISSAEGQMELTFIEPVGYVSIMSNSPQWIGFGMNFTIYMSEKGQETCFRLETGDSSVYYYTTEKGDCGEFYPGITKQNISGIFPKHQDSLVVFHNYSTWDFYTAKVTAINHLSAQNASVTVLASEVICNYPEVNITNLGISAFYPTRLARSEKMSVYVDTTLQCEYASKTKYEWKIYKYNPSNGKLTPTLFDNQTDYGFDPYTQKDLIIKKKTLWYGIYLIKVTVTMANPKTTVFKQAARGYLQIYPSELIAAVEGGALIRRGSSKPIPVSAGASCDPDIKKNDFTGMNFTWYCFNAMESVDPAFALQHNEIPNYKVAVLNPLPYDKDVVKKGGCYGNGTYFFNTTDKIFNLDATKMAIDQAYVIMLILSKGQRTSLGYQVIEVVKGLPPEMGIECKENCLEKINPSGKYALMSTCKGEVCKNPDLQYEWEVYTVKEITAEGKIIWELDTHVMKAVEQYRREVVFVIKKFTLTPSKLYRFTLRAGLPDGAKGLAQRNGFTNTPPKGGRCFSDAEEGEAMTTLFTFTCLDWEDEDIPLRYEFVYYNEAGAESLFFFGASNVATGKLPMGAEKDNFTIRFDVRVIDVYEATSVVTFNVTVREPKLTEDEMIAKLLNMTQGENSELEIIVNSGDTQAIAKLMNSVTSILNKNSDKAGKRKKERSKMLAHLSINGTLQINGSVVFHNGTVLHNNKTAVLGNGTIIQKNGTVEHPNGTLHHNGTWLFGNHTGFNITELTEEQQRQLDRETIRAAMIKALSNQKSTSLEAMRQNADVMGSLTKSKDEVNAEAQEASAGSMIGMTSQLSGESSGEDGAGSDAVEGVAGTMASGLGNLLGSAAGSAKPKVMPKTTTTRAPTTTVSIEKFENLFDDEFITVSDIDEDFVETDPAKLKAQETVAGVFKAAGDVGSSMTGKKLPGEESTVIDSPSMAMASGQVDPEKMGAPVCSPSGAGFKMPKNGNLLKNAGNSTKVPAIGQQMTAMKDNPFTWDPSGGVSGTVTSVVLNSGGGNGLKVDGADEPIEITMPREGEVDPPALVSFGPDTQKYVYHKVEIENNTAFTAHIIPVGNYSEPPFNGSVMLSVYVRRKLKPTNKKYDWSFVFPKENNETFDACNPAPPEANYTLFISDKYLSEGVYWIGVGYLAPPGMPEEALVNTTLNYTLRIFTSQCKYWDEPSSKWKTDGCHVGPKTDMGKTHCLCTHLTSFGGGLITAPAPIDFSKVFAGFKDMFASGNVGVFFTIVGMFGLYILLAVYSRRMDKKEEAQMGVTPIFNPTDPDSNYQYEMTFYTNRGSNSGTTAQVFINLVGTKGESGPMPLKDTERDVFIPGAVNSFLLMVPNNLGEIKHARLWHDNGGYSPAWNIQKITMRDLQNNEQWIFLGGWWALDEGDFQIDKQIKPATEADLADFKLLFQEKLMKDLGDAHIWFSIFLRPPTSRFTRLQRLSCCLTILCLTMVSSAMFYGAGPASAEDDANAIAIGPVRVSLKMVIIGVQSTLVVMPPTVLIVFLFASAKRRNAITIENSLKKARDKKEREENGEGSDDEMTVGCCCFKRKRKRKTKSKSCFRCCRRGADDSESEVDEFDILGEENEGFERDSTSRLSRRSLKPRIRGYYSSSDEGESEASYMSSSDEIDTSPESEEEEGEPILDMAEIEALEAEANSKMAENDGEPKKKGLIMKLIERFTKEKELTPEKKLEKEKKEVEALEKQIHGSLPWWVIYPAWVLVFLGSTCPALFTLFYSMMWGKVKSNEWLTTQALSFFQDTFVSRPLKIIVITTMVAILLKNKPNAEDDSVSPEPLEEDDIMITSGLENEPKADLEAMCKPPNAKRVAIIRAQKLKEKKMSSILRELTAFIFYILLLFLVSASNRDIHAYQQRAVIDRLLKNGGSKYTPMVAVDKVNSVHKFWDYVNQTFIPAMYFESWYNGDYYNYTAYAMLRDTKRLGITRLRQIRTKNDTCTIHPKFRKHITDCNGKYTMANEDHKWYKAGWKDPKKKSGKQKKRFSPWKYASGFESRNIIPVMASLETYAGGGYLGELGINEAFSLMYERYMKKYSWVDSSTRAVFLEFTLYNPNLNLISVGEIMFEFFNFGGVLPKAEVYVSRMYRNLIPEHKIFLAFDIIFFIYVLYCFYRECKKMKQLKKEYFKCLDNITNLILVVLGFGVMGTYAIRSMSLGTKIGEFIEAPHLFISFYQNAMYHEMVAVLMSLIDFIAIIKFLMFLQFNRNFLTLIQTVVRAAPKLALFCMYISLWIVAFVFFSYLLMGAERYNFSSLQRSTYSLNLLLLGVFDWNDFMSRPMVGPWLFVVYCVMMTFMLMNIFMTILMECYAMVQMDEELKKREFHLMEYMMESFMLSMGIKKAPGIGDEEIRWRKKDPYVQRINRLQRSIEDKRIKKMNKMINKLHADELIEDIEMVSLEMMSYPDEFFDLIPCSIKVKLQTMLRRGEIDYKTYCEFLEISLIEEETGSITSRASLDSQKTLNFVPDFEDEQENLKQFFREETDTITSDLSTLDGSRTTSSATNDQDVPHEERDTTEEEYLSQYQRAETFSPRGIATISQLNLQIPDEEIEIKQPPTLHELPEQLPTPYELPEQPPTQYDLPEPKQQLLDSAVSLDLNTSQDGSNAHLIVSKRRRGKPKPRMEMPTIPSDQQIVELPNSQRNFSPDTSIDLGADDSNPASSATYVSLDSTRDLLQASQDKTVMVAASRRKKKKKNTSDV